MILRGRIDEALLCAQELDSVEQWKTLGDLVLKNWNVFKIFLSCVNSSLQLQRSVMKTRMIMECYRAYTVLVATPKACYICR